MNYQKHYDALIQRARGRTITGYSERHHVLPKCMGGSDDETNLVRLTPEEHYVAHQLLVKMHPERKTLIFAAQRMTQGRPSNKLYGWIRRRHAESQRGKLVSVETRQKMSEAKRGKPQPASQVSKRVAKTSGQRRSEEFRRHASAIRTGKSHSAERISQITAGVRKSHASGRERLLSVLAGHKKQAGAMRGRKQSPEQIARARSAWLASMRRKLEAGEHVPASVLPLLRS